MAVSDRHYTCSHAVAHSNISCNCSRKHVYIVLPLRQRGLMWREKIKEDQTKCWITCCFLMFNSHVLYMTEIFSHNQESRMKSTSICSLYIQWQAGFRLDDLQTEMQREQEYLKTSSSPPYRVQCLVNYFVFFPASIKFNSTTSRRS